MKAALLRELAAIPDVADIDEPSGPGVLVETLAAALNPLDVTIASGRFGGGHPPLPYVPGIEAVGRRMSDGAMVYAMGGGLGVSVGGTAAVRFLAPESALIEVTNDVAPEIAVALGTPGLAAWLGLEWKAGLAAGETVVVVGATGSGGRLALQIAKLLGAQRVIGVGRTESALSEVARHADAVVSCDSGDYAGRLQSVTPEGADVVLDFLWGPPLEGSLAATKIGARVVQVGAAASLVATLPSSLLRAKRLTILGYTNFAVPHDVMANTYRRLLDHAVAGQVMIDNLDVRSLDQVAGAWETLLRGGRKVVLLP